VEDLLKELVERVDREGPLDPRSKFGAFEELVEEADIGADLPEGLNPKSEAKRPSKSFMAFGLSGSPSLLPYKCCIIGFWLYKTK